MNVKFLDGRATRNTLVLSAASCILTLSLVGGCPGTVEPPPGNGGEPPAGQTTARIVSPTTGFGVSFLSASISVLYDLPDEAADISGYYVEVEGPESTSPRVGDPVIVAVSLPTGQSRAFNFVPSAAGVGYFRVGVMYTLDGQQLTVESQAVIQVQGAPDPVFTQPSQAITSVEQGDSVNVAFDARDPENNVQWRLFRWAPGQSRTGPVDQLGTTLAVGAGNEGSFTMNTAGLIPGDYQLGLSATDTGLSVAATVARGDAARVATIPSETTPTPIIRVVEPGVLVPPTIEISAPGAATVVLFRNDPFNIQFDAEVLEEGAVGEIEVFYDNDRDPTNGFTTIADNLPESTTSVALPTTLPEGTYNIGATIRDFVNAPVTVYATGQIVVIRTINLSVTQPSSPLPVTPGTMLTVSWQTNAPPQAGSVSVYRRSVDMDDEPFGPEIPILTEAPLFTTSASFTSNVSGRFRVSVRINVRDNSTVVSHAPALVRFSSLPGIVWLGSLADENGPVEGAIFGGVNFEDNAGSAFTDAGDLDGDGFDDFIIAARYGKPFFLNPTGIGPGEAYAIYGEGGAGKLRGEFNLNSVGTPLLRGVTLTGIRTESDAPETDGLSDITRIPDADNDGVSELAFGFPSTNSRARGLLSRSGQCLRGGVIILSSANSRLENPGFVDPIIHLDAVGQGFDDTSNTSNPADILADFLTFQEGDPNAAPPVLPGCETGTDGILESVIGPPIGFIYDFACPRWEHPDVQAIQNFVCMGLPTVCDPNSCLPPQPEALELCDSRTFSSSLRGTGFHPPTATPLEPRGARIIGKNVADGFGTSIAVSNSLGLPGRGDLIISAPRRTATVGEVHLLGTDQASSGVAYLFDNSDRWGRSTNPANLPSPHQYMVDTASHIGRGGLIGAIRIAGQTNDRIEVMEGVPDFNSDGRNDFAMGAPTANAGRGRVYVAYRRAEAIEGDYVLGKLARDPDNDPERLTGMLITSSLVTGFGFSLASGANFNGGNAADLAIGAPTADGGIGEVVIVFSQTGINTPLNGYTYQQMLREIRTPHPADPNAKPVAVRIQGNRRDPSGNFGFNIANAGDVNGDGFNDLLISAPNATPRFDLTPHDEIDDLDTPGIDLNMDGIADLRSDCTPSPSDNCVIQVAQAGLVYVIYGSNRLDQIRTCRTCPANTSIACTGSAQACNDNEDCPLGETCGSHDYTINIDQLGTGQLRGFIIAGRWAGDRIGGGDAGETAEGGNPNKFGRGRSRGLAKAGDVDGDGRSDILIGSVLADPRRDPTTRVGVQNGGEAYLLYGSMAP